MVDSAFHTFKVNQMTTCPTNIYLLKVTIETLEKGVKYVQSQQ